VLKKVFSSPDLRAHIVFKGGTSLSKVFGLIERFSEDIDLILDWRLLGYGPGQIDPYRDHPSRTQRDRFNREFNQRAAAYIAETLCPRLIRLFSSCTELAVGIDADDPQVVRVNYPAAFPAHYLRPEIRLEIGPLASFVPSGHHTIVPYAAEEFPDVFDSAACPVVAVDAERTFWEKATILHQQAHRTTPMPPDYTRHYYDVFMLAGSPVRASALADPALLRDVVRFKERFYRCSWAQYDLARPGTFRLIPPAERLVALRRDYRAMTEMILGIVPDFGAIVAAISELEEAINRLAPAES